MNFLGLDIKKAEKKVKVETAPEEKKATKVSILKDAFAQMRKLDEEAEKEREAERKAKKIKKEEKKLDKQTVKLNNLKNPEQETKAPAVEAETETIDPAPEEVLNPETAPEEEKPNETT